MNTTEGSKDKLVKPESFDIFNEDKLLSWEPRPLRGDFDLCFLETRTAGISVSSTTSSSASSSEKMIHQSRSHH